MIRLLVLDVDGVLTDGRVEFDADGVERKMISYRDVDAIFQARREGLRIALLTGESGPLVEALARRLQAEAVTSGAKDKVTALRELCAKLGVPLGETCFVGDGVRDADALAIAGVGLAPADAAMEARMSAARVLRAPGGRGAVAEALALVRRTNLSDAAIRRRNPLGIMQGRLSPPDTRRLQAFPHGTWEPEFEAARDIGLDSIEWLFEAERFRENPIWSESGRDRIRELSRQTGVAVLTLCADYFMPHRLHRAGLTERAKNLRVLSHLIPAAASIGVRRILFPVLEESAVTTVAEAEQLAEGLGTVLEIAADHDIQIGLETELPAKAYRELVERCAGGSAALGVYYDTGNCAAKGLDVGKELRELSDLLCGVHLKDRELQGGSVRLGRGAVRFDDVFRSLAEVGYHGPLVMQTAFGESYRQIASEHAAYVRGLAAIASGKTGGPPPSQ